MDLLCYQKMYAILCAAASEAIDQLQEPSNCLYTRQKLQDALLRAEELYLTWGEEDASENCP